MFSITDFITALPCERIGLAFQIADDILDATKTSEQSFTTKQLLTIWQWGATSKMDELLQPFLNATTEAESSALLEQLVCNHAQPLIQNILRFKLKASYSARAFHTDVQEVDDIAGAVILRLIRALQECKAAPDEKPINSLRSYVAVMAYNASDEYLRQKYPQRFSLKNKIRYLLTHQSGLHMWESAGGETLCGLASWQQSNSETIGKRSSSLMPDELASYLQKRFAGRVLERVALPELLPAVFDYLNSPIAVDDLVTMLAEILGIREPQRQTDIDNTNLAEQRFLSVDPRAQLDASIDSRNRLERVWQEVRQLPQQQRVALLFNLRDETGGSALVLMPLLRIASIRQIAEALELSAEELAAIWNQLPLEDAAIATRLGATRQQVINLRKCARERLARRLTKPK